MRHDQLLADIGGTLDALATHFALPRPDTDTIDAVMAHHDPSLHHHHAASIATGAEANHNPVVALANTVWNDGTLALDALATPALGHALQQGIEEGWLRPPSDTAALDRTRARNIDLTNLLRRRTRRRIQLQQSSSPPPELPL